MADTIITSVGGRGTQGPPGPPGSSNATTLLGAPLDPNVVAPSDGEVLIFDAGTGKWTASALDVGTF